MGMELSWVHGSKEQEIALFRAPREEDWVKIHTTPPMKEHTSIHLTISVKVPSWQNSQKRNYRSYII
jgi:hypothetical protein